MSHLGDYGLDPTSVAKIFSEAAADAEAIFAENPGMIDLENIVCVDGLMLMYRAKMLLMEQLTLGLYFHLLDIKLWIKTRY